MCPSNVLQECHIGTSGHPSWHRQAVTELNWPSVLIGQYFEVCLGVFCKQVTKMQFVAVSSQEHLNCFYNSLVIVKSDSLSVSGGWLKKKKQDRNLNSFFEYSIAASVSTHLILHVTTEEHTTNYSPKQNVALVVVLSPPGNQFELLLPSLHVQLGLKWNVALMRFLLRVNPDTTHSLFSLYMADYIISFHQTWKHTRVWQRTVGGERIGDWKRSKERLEEALIQETERSWHKDKKQSPQGLGSMCRHNEQSQTYPASLISTIKAIFSAQHAAASSAVCGSPHLSPKIKTS